MMLLFPILAKTAIGAGIALVIWGASTFAVVPPLQMRVMEVVHEAQGLASSVNIGVFKLGNAVGAAAGGAVPRTWLCGGIAHRCCFGRYYDVVGSLANASSI